MYEKKPAVSVLIVSSSEKAEAYLRELLPPSQFSPVTSASDGGEAKRLLLDRPADIVLINAPLTDEFGLQLAQDIAEDSATGVLIFVKEELYEQVCDRAEDSGILTVARPCGRQAVYQAVRLLVATASRLNALERRASSLEAKMKEIRLVNRAKLLLVDRLRMSESEAHRYIEKAAMDRCVKRQEIAENIIKTYDN